jgi:hypothetical protein
MTIEMNGDQIQHAAGLQHWSLSKKIGCRFSFVYFGLYCVANGILAALFVIPDFRHALFVPAVMTLWPMRQIIFWTATHLFHVTHPLIYTGSGSGDKTFDWIAAFILLFVALVATGIWSLLDRRRANYTELYKYFRLFIRFALASEMLLYGTIKIFPNQMPFPFLTRWVEPFGNFTPMGVLWNSIGAAPAYERFAGCAETLGGILLTIPRTTTFGALICLADLIQIFMLNMTYDVPVKLFSFHLILMALFILAPELLRLMFFFFSQNVVGPSTQMQIFRTRRANKIAFAAQVVFGLYLLGTYSYLARLAWYANGGGRARSEFYGIWDVDQLSIDGQVRPPIVTDNTRWRRLIFDFQTSVNFQRMDDSFAGYGAAINSNDKTIVLGKSDDPNWKAKFTFERPAKNELIFDGEMDQHNVRLQLKLTDLDKYALANGKFHWIAEYPMNRLEVRR